MCDNVYWSYYWVLLAYFEVDCYFVLNYGGFTDIVIGFYYITYIYLQTNDL